MVRVSRRSRRRKGQIFVIVALLVILMIAFFAPTVFRVRVGPTELAARQFFDNMRAEFPHAVNVALAENATSDSVIGRAKEFYNFSRERGAEKQFNFFQYYIFGLPIGGDTLNVTVGNLYLGELLDINITVNTVTQSIPSLGVGEAVTLNFSLAGNETINFTYLLRSDELETRSLNTSIRAFALSKFRVVSEQQLLQDIVSY